MADPSPVQLGATATELAAREGGWAGSSTPPAPRARQEVRARADDARAQHAHASTASRQAPAVDFFRNSATVQITSPKRARHLDEYTQNVLEEETRYDDVDWLTLMMIYSGTGSFFNINDKVSDSA